MRFVGRLVAILALLSMCAARAASQPVRLDAERFEKGPEGKDSYLANWWLGAYFRHLWVPSYMTEPFFERAPSVTNTGFGLAATYHSDSGLNLVLGAGYMPYHFSGPFLADNQPITDTELVDSDLAFVHLTASLLWDFEFHESFALELGFGLDVGVLTGDITRNEAYLQDDRFQNCRGPADPDVTFDDVPFCNSEEAGGSITNDPSEQGEHYNVEEDRVPPVIAFPMIPHVALRVKPLQHMAIKLEFAFGVVQMWVGASLHGSFGLFAPEPEPVVEKDVAPDAFGAEGRVMGRVLEAGTDAPVAGATVRLTARALSPLSSMDDGRFIVDRLPSGPVRFEIEHPGYAPAECTAEIPATGGDVHVNCRLTPKPRLGAISGRLQNEAGQPVTTRGIALQGPVEQQLASDERGLFAAADLPEGAYRIRVDAQDYLLQVVEVEVRALETATPQIILIEKPQRSRVKLRQKEILITQQIQFKSGSAEIEAESEPLMREIADVLLRNEQIERVEIQGHTDNTGPREFNLRLSQQRAEAVRDWLRAAGVSNERLEPKGYGPDHPIRPNNSAQNRAKNRRVQFIIGEPHATPAE